MALPSILLDTNLLLLYTIGCASPNYVNRHGRLTSYHSIGPKAYVILRDALATAPSLVVTPNILTEASNLLGWREWDDVMANEIATYFQILIGNIDERNVVSVIASQRPEFRRFGLADTVTLEVLDESMVLFTDDGNLYAAALALGHKAELFRNRLETAGVQ